MSEIDVSKYFKNYRNEYGLTFAIEYIGNPKDLIREIKQQNELLISYKEENEELKNLLKYYFKDNSSNYDNFYDICSANGKCNGSCRYEQ